MPFIKPGPFSGTIQRHVDRLGSPDAQVRREASEALYDLCRNHGEEAARAVPALVRSLSDADGDVRHNAACGLSYCGKHAVKPLIECLSNDDPKVRRHAALAVGMMEREGLAAAGALRKRLADEDAEVRDRAAQALGAIRDTDPRTVDALLRMARGLIAGERAAALHALGKIGRAIDNSKLKQPWADQVFQVLKEQDPDVRYSAFYVLNCLDLDPQRGIPLLVDGLGDEDELICDLAIAGLVKLAEDKVDISQATEGLAGVVARGDYISPRACEALSLVGPKAKAAVPEWLAALESDDPSLVTGAAVALWKVDRRIEESLPVLSELLKTGKRGDGDLVCEALDEIGSAAAPMIPQLLEALGSDNRDLQSTAARALGAIGSADPKVIEALSTALDHQSLLIYEDAAGALARIGKEALAPLMKVLAEGDQRRQEAVVIALGRVGPGAREAVVALKGLLEHENRDLRLRAAVALARIAKSPEAVPVLIEALRSHEAGGARYYSAKVLGEMGPTARDAIPALHESLKDQEEAVRNAAQAALEQITPASGDDGR